MPIFTTLESAGTEKTLAAWGVAQTAIPQTETNLRAGTLRLTLPQSSVAAPAVFPYLGKIILRTSRVSATGAADSFSDGAVEFIGYRMLEIVQNSARWGGVHYDFQNAWFFIEQTRFQQRRAVIPTSYPDLLYKYTTDVILGMKLGASNTRVELNNGQQIVEALQFVLDNTPAYLTAPLFLIGTIDCDTPLPFFPTAEISCQEVIQKCLDLSPDCTVYFDYSTTSGGSPCPTVRVRQRANLAPVTLRAVCSANGKEMADLNIQRRDDIMPDAVLIYYNLASSIQGVSYVDPRLDKFGPHGANSASDPSAGFGIVMQTFDLIGPSFNSISAVLDVETCDANNASQTARLNWWKTYSAKLENAKNLTGTFNMCEVTSITIGDATVTAHGDQPGFSDGDAVSLATYPNVLLDTTIFDWMRVSNTPVNGVRVKLKATAVVTYNKRASQSGYLTPCKPESFPVEAFITLTNGISGTYTSSGGSAGETPPVGFARKLYLALGGPLNAGADAAYPAGRAAIYQYQGQHVRVEATITSPVTMANTLNLSNGRAEWATMNAQVQSITKDHADGRTTVSIGPATHVSAGNLLAVQLWNRTRLRITVNPTQRETGLA